jgi:Rod binding domain-containing protein
MAELGLTGAGPVARHIPVGISPQPRLVRAAHQFEAMMMKELLAPLSHKSALFDDGKEEDTGVLGEFAAESLAGGLSARGGLGIADRIVGALSHSGNPSASAPVTGRSPIDTGMRTGE